MEIRSCKRCGSTEFMQKGNGYVCLYCRSAYHENAGSKSGDSVIAISHDVENLLEKCRTNPSKASKYANLVLDIDPGNSEALKYL